MLLSSATNIFKPAKSPSGSVCPALLLAGPRLLTSPNMQLDTTDLSLSSLTGLLSMRVTSNAFISSVNPELDNIIIGTVIFLLRISRQRSNPLNSGMFKSVITRSKCPFFDSRSFIFSIAWVAPVASTTVAPARIIGRFIIVRLSSMSSTTRIHLPAI